MLANNINRLKCFKCLLSSNFYFSVCDKLLYLCSGFWKCYLFVSLLLSSSTLHHIFPHPLITSPPLFFSRRRSFCKPVFHICRLVCLLSFVCIVFLTFHPLPFLPPTVSLTTHVSILIFIFPPKASIYLPVPINMSIHLNSLFIFSLSPPHVLQDIHGGNRLLQPLLSNDLSGGAVLSQETGGLPLHHPHRRYWHVLCVCVRERMHAYLCLCVNSWNAVMSLHIAVL